MHQLRLCLLKLQHGFDFLRYRDSAWVAHRAHAVRHIQ
jgi:hypothetical protein